MLAKAAGLQFGWSPSRGSARSRCPGEHRAAEPSSRFQGPGPVIGAIPGAIAGGALDGARRRPRGSRLGRAGQGGSCRAIGRSPRGPAFALAGLGRGRPLRHIHRRSGAAKPPGPGRGNPESQSQPLGPWGFGVARLRSAPGLAALAGFDAPALGDACVFVGRVPARSTRRPRDVKSRGVASRLLASRSEREPSRGILLAWRGGASSVAIAQRHGDSSSSEVTSAVSALLSLISAADASHIKHGLRSGDSAGDRFASACPRGRGDRKRRR